MKISIVTPVFNTVETLERTILSVINQNTDVDIEYIVIDGGSTDGSIEVVNKYLDRIDIFVSEKDKGVYDAMNKGIARATGDIIGIINADDWYNDGALRVVQKVFMEHQDISILYSPVDNYLDEKFLNTFIPGTLDNLVFKFTLNHPSCFVKKSIYDSIGMFDLSYSICADYDFIFRAYNSGIKFYYIEIPLASYSLNGMSAKPSNRFKLIKESWSVVPNYQLSRELIFQRQKFYLYWCLKELIAFPIKYFLKPQKIKEIKQILRQKTGNLPSDKYGIW